MVVTNVVRSKVEVLFSQKSRPVVARRKPFTLKSPLKVEEARTNMPALELVGVRSLVKILFQEPGVVMVV